jgi:hypothetical protein
MCLRRDVDDLNDLQQAVELGVGEFTSSSLNRTGAMASAPASGQARVWV